MLNSCFGISNIIAQPLNEQKGNNTSRQVAQMNFMDSAIYLSNMPVELIQSILSETIPSIKTILQPHMRTEEGILPIKGWRVGATERYGASSVYSIAFSNGTLLASGSAEHTRLWDPFSGELIRTLSVKLR